MAFSYTAGSTAERDRVRLEIGDTDSDRVLFQDAELDDFLAQEGESIMGAAAKACETLAVKFARDYTFSADGGSFQKGNITVMYQKLARRLRNRARGTTVIMPRRKDGYSVYTDSDEVTGLNILDSGTGMFGRYADG
jgi:hypothetical protein